MWSATRRFLKDESGVAVGDYALLASVLVLGSALGVIIVRQALEADAERTAKEASKPDPQPERE
jgi:Flp pilus assembly pilin Flp